MKKLNTNDLLDKSVEKQYLSNENDKNEQGLNHMRKLYENALPRTIHSQRKPSKSAQNLKKIQEANKGKDPYSLFGTVLNEMTSSSYHNTIHNKIANSDTVDDNDTIKNNTIPNEIDINNAPTRTFKDIVLTSQSEKSNNPMQKQNKVNINNDMLTILQQQLQTLSSMVNVYSKIANIDYIQSLEMLEINNNMKPLIRIINDNIQELTYIINQKIQMTEE